VAINNLPTVTTEVVKRGENDVRLWRASRSLNDVARADTELDPDQRFASVTEFLRAWRSA
jgi:hypothetical protein